ncbi:MAG: AbrB/MazE/SpoVT family DNA-binding domain-containing protein [Acidovorax sp.]|uniref:antitoxin n=1 Tax=Acidovorax sp. TaxID=1872122 RepID=UPI0039E681B6
MSATAKVFTTGNSQAVRLPKAFRLETAEVWIRRNEATGEITLTPKPAGDGLEAFLSLLQSMPPSPEFILPRDDAPAPDPLADWTA